MPVMINFSTIFSRQIKDYQIAPCS